MYEWNFATTIHFGEYKRKRTNEGIDTTASYTLSCNIVCTMETNRKEATECEINAVPACSTENKRCKR